MQFDKLTIRSQEALQEAQRVARDENQQEISPLHLMLAAMGQQDGVALPLKRAIQRSIQDPLALKVLEGEFREGDTVEVDVEGKGEFTFQKKS